MNSIELYFDLSWQIESFSSTVKIFVIESKLVKVIGVLFWLVEGLFSIAKVFVSKYKLSIFFAMINYIFILIFVWQKYKINSLDKC